MLNHIIARAWFVLSLFFVVGGNKVVIGMGLPKTGTTSTGEALHRAGLSVSHHMGDTLSHCDAILNTMEAEYETLGKSHPTAKWLILYSYSVADWVASVESHARYLHKKHGVKLTYLPCVFYGCNKGTPTSLINATTKDGYLWYRRWVALERSDGSLTPTGRKRLVAAYQLYYKRLFNFLGKRPYTVVDVRKKVYKNLWLISPKLKGPFPHMNTKGNRGGWDNLRCKPPGHSHFFDNAVVDNRTLEMAPFYLTDEDPSYLGNVSK